MIGSTAVATIVQVDIVGSVDYGQLNFGSWAGKGPGTSAIATFQVDSNNYLDGFYPTRGYVIIPGSFTLTIGGVSAGMLDPYPLGEEPYFTLRNNDPVADGFLLNPHPDWYGDGPWTTEPGLIDSNFRMPFSAGYEGWVLDSLDIMDALGTYDFTDLTSFNWGLSDAGFQPVGLIFDYFSIAAVPAPATVGALVALPFVARRRRATA